MIEYPFETIPDPGEVQTVDHLNYLIALGRTGRQNRDGGVWLHATA